MFPSYYSATATRRPANFRASTAYGPSMRFLAKQNDQQHNQQNETQATAGIVSPACAIWPRWQGGDEQQKQNQEQNKAHSFYFYFASAASQRLRTRRSVDIYFSFLFLGSSRWRWVYHCGVTFFFLRRRIRHRCFLLLASHEQCHGCEHVNIFLHTSESHFRTKFAAFTLHPFYSRTTLLHSYHSPRRLTIVPPTCFVISSDPAQ